MGNIRLYSLKGKRVNDDIIVLIKLLLFILLLIFTYSVIFHFIMENFEGKGHSWITGIYWTLTTMTTLGYGDITFSSDAGRLFSVIVLVSGLVLLLIALPYTFINFVIAPLIETAAKTRVPKKPTVPLKDHVIICGEDSIALNLVHALRSTNQPFVFLERDENKAEVLFNRGLPVVHGDYFGDKIFKKLNIDSAKIVFANQSDVINSHIALTIRAFSSVKIIALAEVGASKDILHYAGCNYVLSIKEILGKYLANRCMAGSIHSETLGSMESLKIAEVPVLGTPFFKKTISSLKIRESTGVNIIGIWERGNFFPPKPEYQLTAKSVLLLMGKKENLSELDDYMSIYIPSDKPIVVIGAGGVGRFVAKVLDKKETPYFLIDVLECDQPLEKGTFIQGDAKERKTLDKAGIREAPTVVITTNDDGVNGYLTLYCRNLNPDLRIVSRVNFYKNQNAIHKAGADFVVSYTMIGTTVINNILQKGRMTLLTEELHIFRYKTPMDLKGKTISVANIGALTECNVIAIQKNGEVLSPPDPSTVLEREDVLVMIGNQEQEESFKRQFKN